jgi:hypothetical protein
VPQISNYIGAPIEKSLKMLQDGWNAKLQEVTQTALSKAADAAIFTMDDTPGDESSELWHKLGAAVSGRVGGFFGIASIPIKLPISITIMLRSIADIASGEGESINTLETKLACLEVLAGKSEIRRFSDTFRSADMVTFSKFLIMAGLVLPLLPNRQISGFILTGVLGGRYSSTARTCRKFTTGNGATPNEIARQ